MCLYATILSVKIIQVLYNVRDKEVYPVYGHLGYIESIVQPASDTIFAIVFM